MSQTPNTAIAVIGIDIGKNSFCGRLAYWKMTGSGRIFAGWNGNATSRDASNTGMSCGLVKKAKRQLWK